MTFRIRSACLITLASFATVPSLHAKVVINEIRIDQPQAGDPDEFFELRGDPNQTLDGLWYLVLGDANSTDGTFRGGGVVEEAISLAGRAIPGSGYFLASQASFSIPTDIPPVFSNDLRFENNDTVTHLLVDGFRGEKGEDLDVDDNGYLDPMPPWKSVVDAVGILKNRPESNTDGDIWEYATTSLFPNSTVGPDGGFAPGHVYRDKHGDWRMGAFDPKSDNAADTPGAVNGLASMTDSCDFTMDGFCNRLDINELYESMDIRMAIPVLAENQKFDLTNDQTINNDDISRWLTLAARHNGYGNASPYWRGDTDDLGRLSPDRRDVDITDFNTLAAHFEPTGAVAARVPWHFGNFDGDLDIDITDFNYLAANFSPGGYNNIQPVQPLNQSVPEPASLVLIAAGVLFVLARSLKRV